MRHAHSNPLHQPRPRRGEWRDNSEQSVSAQLSAENGTPLNEVVFPLRTG
jgi:hypothetical protein